MARNFPIVDAQALFNSSSTSAERKQAAINLTEACHRFGFVAITGHGMGHRLYEKAFATLKQLFALPHEVKMKAPHPEGPVPHRGYSAPGTEQVYSKEEAADDTAAVRKISEYKESYETGSQNNSVHYNIWLPEDDLPGFKDFCLDLFWRLDKLAEKILDAFATGLDVNTQERQYMVKEIRTGDNNQLRFLHYPPIPKDMIQQQILARMTAHTDWSLFTVLFQDEIGGLEMEDPGQRGNWKKAQPGGDALVLNVGDMLERVTNGYFPSAQHRVSLPTSGLTGNGGSRSDAPSRYSIPYFFAPDEDAVIRPLQSLVSKTGTKPYEEIKFSEYADFRAKHSYGHKELEKSSKS